MNVPAILRNSIDIACTPAALFDYVTQPWRWHEWHPSSLSASDRSEPLRVGDHFDERIAVQPLSPLPLTLQRAVRYEVLRSERAHVWEVRGVMQSAWLNIHYEFAAIRGGTRFERTLTYEASGFNRLLMPLLAPRMAAKSVIALDNLKRRMERSTAD